MRTTKSSMEVSIFVVIEINGQQWSVEKVDAHHTGLFVEGAARRGAAWCGQTEIYLSNELRGDQVARVAMHELAHAYIYSTQAISPEVWNEEDVCELFALYAREMSTMCQVVVQKLYPEVKLRPWSEVLKEART